MSGIVIVLMPDVEQLVVNFLLDQDELSGFEQRIYTELPKDKVFPAARVHQFNDQQVSGPALWLMRYSLQVDVWGGPKVLTRELAETTRALLVARLAGGHPEGVVTGAPSVGGLDTTPDGASPTENGRARPRCRFDLELFAHPAPTVIGS